MNRTLLLMIWSCLLVQAGPTLLEGRPTESSAPFLSGDTFRSLCTWCFDEMTTSFSTERVMPGDTIFVKTDFLASFFRTKHPWIKGPYILVTHNSDSPVPGRYSSYLDDPKIFAWFTENPDIVHPKLHPLPIGLANAHFHHGKVLVLKEALKKIGSVPRMNLVYLNFTIGTYVKERQVVFDLFSKLLFCRRSPVKVWSSYLNDLLSTCFVLSPRGYGLDAYRTWEALYMGAIPIVKESPLDSLYEGLPVLVVKEWEPMTEPFLRAKYEEMQKITYDTQKLYTPYWIEQLRIYRERAKDWAKGQASMKK